MWFFGETQLSETQPQKMKFELVRFINEIRVKSAQFNRLRDAYESMKLWISTDPGEFDTRTRYEKHFIMKNLGEDHVIFPNERQTEGKDFFLLRLLEPIKRPLEAESEDCPGDLYPMRWEKQPHGFAVVYAMILKMSQDAYDKFTAARARSLQEYMRLERELSDRKGKVDLSPFAELTAEINACEQTYLLDVREFLMYMCQSDLPPVESLYNLAQLCAHSPANKQNVQLQIFSVAMKEIFNLRDFNVRDMGLLGGLLKQSFDCLKGESYENEEILELFSKVDMPWFLDPSFSPFIKVFIEFGGAALLWKAIPIDQDFTLAKLDLLESLRDDMCLRDFLVNLDRLYYTHAQIQFYVFSGHDSPNDESSYALMFQFFTQKGDAEQAQRMKSLKQAKFPDLRPLPPPFAVV